MLRTYARRWHKHVRSPAVRNPILLSDRFSPFAAPLSLFIWLCLCPASAYPASLKEINFPFTLRTESEYFTLQSAEDSERPGFLTFQVKTPHEFYEIETLPELRKSLNEIEVIEKIRQGKAGSGFAGGAVDTVKATGEGVKNLVTDPVQSGKNMGSAVGKIGRGIGGVFRSKEAAEKSSFQEKVFGGSERDLARELGVDVYTRNKTLSAMISEMSRSRTGGKGVVTVGKFLLPVAFLVSAAVSAGTINSAADELVNSQSRGTLYSANKKALEDLGFADSDIQTFLNKAFYTPRETTYLRFYLEALKNAAGYHQLFRKGLKVNDIWEARELLYAAELAAESARTLEGQLSLEVYNEGLALSSVSDFVFLVPYDYIEVNSELSKKIFERVKVLKTLKPLKSVELRVSGQGSSQFVSAAEKQGIQVKNWMLFRTLTTDPNR